MSKGQSLIELLIAIALASLILPALLTGFITSREGKVAQQQYVQATALMKETIEALRSIRERGWASSIASLSVNTDYYPTVTPGSWTLTSGIETVNSYERKVVVSDVYRNISGAITDSPGALDHLDPSTKKFTITVSWANPTAGSISSEIYLTRYLDNASFIQPVPIAYSAASPLLTRTKILGSPEYVELDLAGTGRGDWCKANATAVSTVDLYGSGVAKAVWAIEGQAFAGTGNNASGLPLAHLTITNPPSPANPTAAVDWTYNPGGNTKTNDMFGDPAYSYISTDSNNEEVIIISNSTRAKVSSFNTPGSSDGTSLYVLNNIGYVLTGSALYTFNMSPPVTGLQRGVSATVNLGAVGTSVKVIQIPQGTFAFVTVNATSNQLKIYKVNSLTSLTLVDQITLGGLGGKDISVLSDGSKAYVVTAYSSTLPELFVVNTSSILTGTGSLSVTGTFDSGGMNPTGVSVVLNGYRALLVGTGGTYQYQVVDLTASPYTLCGYATGFGSNAVYDVSAVVEADTDAWAYIVTGNSNSEFQIIEGGAGGMLAPDGVYESGPFDSLSISAYNRLEATIDKPTGAEVKFKVAVANPGTSCANASYTFDGPDGNPATDDYFQNPASGIDIKVTGAIPVLNLGNYINPARCLKYRAYLSSTPPFTSSPKLKQTIINYTP